MTQGKRTKKITRREFLTRTSRVSAMVALPWIVPAPVIGTQTSTAPSERLTMGLIGHGAMGRGHLHRLAGDREVQVLAVCDVDRVRREEARQIVDETYAARKSDSTYKGCTAYNDYRELLARSDIDAVVIATPDHWHSLQAIHAVEAGKDVYCEKPISLNVQEGRRLVETVRRYGRIFQTGTQYRSISTIRKVCEFVRAGGLGKVKSVFTLWGPLNGSIAGGRFKPYAQAMDAERSGRSYAPMHFDLPGEPVPDGLDWNLWVGPAPWQAYNSVYHVNPSPGVVPWAFCEDFGAGAVTWYHSHAADVIQYALGVETSSPVEFIHPSSGAYPTLTCRYANGTLLHLVDNWEMVKTVYQAVPADARLAGNFGGVFVGERGWVTSMTTGGPIEGGPAEIFAEMKLATREVNPGDNNHHANWFECIRTRRPTSCGEEIGHCGASLGHLTIIAYKLQRSLKWNPVAEEFPGDDAANRLLGRSLRSPWHL
ncbi:MAG: Gfo/Idh/MocA family oxidoreductase [Phycisphaerae bacterium]|nr:Gfo/Idh/MocA family oxidoreductase [Phycisphaerae bacterium]